MAIIKQGKRKIVVDAGINGEGWSNMDGVKLHLGIGNWSDPKRARLEFSREEAQKVVETFTKLLADTAHLE